MTAFARRPVYFDAWFPRQNCYHPSLPPRRLAMIDHLESYRSTMLVWSALGGGSISLPYLEEEAFGEIEARFRFYGFVNDSEFVAECHRRDIKVFGIVFEVQGWEFPAELNETGDRVLALNEVRESGAPAWLGLREFSQNNHPKLWAPIEKYFPDGLINSDGEIVTDLLEECCSRDIHGAPCHAHWVEVPDRDGYCYTMDRNNPVWREYLKAVIRIQIDAGVDGVQLDEAELPLTSLQYGGCFCKDCMKGFRVYLQAHPEVLPEDLSSDALGKWHYGEWLLERGFDFKDDQAGAPMFLDYLRFQRGEITKYFTELADYAREYAQSQGREILVSGNFFNVHEQYLPLEPAVDVIVTEMRNTTHRQPAWYRYVRGFGRDKPVVIVENPYGGVVPHLAEDLGRGNSYDLFRMSIYEASALGANMSLPYGSWMGSVEKNSFWAPHDLCAEIGEWLAAHEHLFSTRSAARTAVVFGAESSFLLESRDRGLANNTLNLSSEEMLPFWTVCEKLSHALQPYDVIVLPEGELRKDWMTAEDLAPYATVVLPHCHVLTDRQIRILLEFADSGGRIVRCGPVASNHPEMRVQLESHARVKSFDPNDFSVDELTGPPQVRASARVNAAVNLQRVPGGIAVHLIRYDFDRDRDAVVPLDELRLDIELDETFDALTAYGAPKPPQAELARNGSTFSLELRDVPLYSVLLLHAREDDVVNDRVF